VTERGLSKEEKRQAREVAAAAHNAELSAALEELALLFSDWHKGRIDAFQLADAIHQFHDGQSRELFNRYRGGLSPEDLAARAIAWELVAPSEIPRGLRAALADRVERWRKLA